MLPLFDYMKILFTGNEKQWKEVNSVDKNRNFFMANRFLSIKYPIQVHILSHIKINSSAVANHWHDTLTRLYKTQPNWIFAKMKKKTVEDKKKNLPSETMIKWYCSHYEMSRKDYDQSIKTFGEAFLDEIRALEKVLKAQGVLKDV